MDRLSASMTNTSVGSRPSTRGTYLASTAVRSCSSRHQVATCGVESHCDNSGKSVRSRGRKPSNTAGLRTAAVRAGDDLEKVAVGVMEVHAAATVVSVDLALLAES